MLLSYCNVSISGGEIKNMDDILEKFFHREIYLSDCEVDSFNNVIKITLAYLEIYDVEHETIRSEVFKDLYSNKRKLPLYVIANKHNLDIKSLYNYRKNFNFLVKIDSNK